MTITLVQKSGGARRRKPKLALVLSGGAMSGGAFKVGGLIALESMFKNFSIMDFDMYLGISAGSFLAASLAAAITPQELLVSFAGLKGRLLPFTPADMYKPNLAEVVAKGKKAGSELLEFYPKAAFSLARLVSRNGTVLQSAARNLLKKHTLENLDQLEGPMSELNTLLEGLPSPQSWIPSGVFDNSRLEQYIRANLRRARVPNHFRLLEYERRKKLYIYSVELDTAQDVVFGPDERHDFTISEAVQASTALPGFFRPAKINGKYYIDGSAKQTAPMELAVRKGADLVICYNPFRPFHHVPTNPLAPGVDSMGDMGFVKVIDQSLRTLLHSRLELSVQDAINEPTFKGDLIVIEPAAGNAEFFSINPLSFWKRADGARHGFLTVVRDVERNYARLKDLFGQYGIEIDLAGIRVMEERLQNSRSTHDVLGALTTPVGGFQGS
jgi:predicted acylesterase/phospholipase RssA